VLHQILKLVPGRWWVGCYISYSEAGLNWWGGSPTAQAPPLCTKCNSPPINGQCTSTVLRYTMVRCSAVLTRPLKGNTPWLICMIFGTAHSSVFRTYLSTVVSLMQNSLLFKYIPCVWCVRRFGAYTLNILVHWGLLRCIQHVIYLFLGRIDVCVCDVCLYREASSTVAMNDVRRGCCSVLWFFAAVQLFVSSTAAASLCRAGTLKMHTHRA